MASDLGQANQVSALPVDPGVLDRVRSSVSQLAEQEDAFAQLFRSELAALIPALPSLLAANGWPFCQRTVRAVLWVVTTSQSPQMIAASLRRVGVANRLDGFPEAKYPNVARALVRTVRDLSGANWSTATGSAWISCFQWIEPHLVIGAQQAALEQQARAGAGPQAPPPQPPAQQAQPGQDELESVAGLLDDDEDEDVSYGQIMVSMSSWRDHHEDED